MQNKKITIGINASFARKPNTGIGQVTINFLRKLINLKSQISNLKDKEIKFILYLEEDLPNGFKLPKNFQKRIFLPLWKRDDLVRKIWWEGHMLPRMVKKDGCNIFVSLYQCPTVIASGAKQSRANIDNLNSTGLPRRSEDGAPRNDKCVHIMLVHDIVPKLFPKYLNNFRKKYYQKLTEKAIKKAGKILTVSKRTEKDLIGHLGIEAEKITVNYIDVDEIYKTRLDPKITSMILKKYHLKPGYVLAGGGLEVRKNVEGSIRAYDYLYKKNKKEKFISEMPKLVVYGKLLPQLAPLATDGEKLARELNLTKQIKFLDVVPQHDMSAIFSEAIMFVYPSHYEGFGMPVLEAMNQGVPVVTSKNSSLPEVGSDGVLYCQDDDIHDIASVMKNVLLNKNLREALSCRAKMQAEKFSWDKFVEKFLNIVSSF